MIVRLIAETLTPIVAKSRFLRVRGTRGVVSNRPYLELEAPAHHQCRTTLIVKQGAHKLPVYRRAYVGVLAPRFQNANAETGQLENSSIAPTPMCRPAHRLGLRGHSLACKQGVPSTSVVSHVSPTVPDSQGITLRPDPR